jgi:hypothetical protein
MRWIAALGGGAFVLVSLVIGARLLRLALRTRRIPEASLGAGLFLMGGLAYPLTSVARQAQALSDETRTGLMIAAHVLMVVGIAAIGLFTQRVFRPESQRARAGLLLLGAALLGCFVWQGLSPGFRAGALAKEGLAIVVINALAAVAMGWTALESIHYASLLKRRLALGLADPEVARKVRQWGLASGAATAITLWTLLLHARGLDPAASAAGALVIGPLGLVAALGLARAFRHGEGHPSPRGRSRPLG